MLEFCLTENRKEEFYIVKKLKYIIGLMLVVFVAGMVCPAPSFANITATPKIEAGWAHSLAIKSDGTVWAWGSNSNCQFGNGSTTSINAPIQINNDITDISAGQYHSLFLKGDGTVWGCGSNLNGELGNGTTTTSKVPVEVSNLTEIVAISNLGSHSLALKSDGTVWAWGKNNYGQLGNGTTNNSSVPTKVSNLTDVIAISSGYWSSLALKSDGTVWIWGQQCPTMICSNVPVKVTNLTGIIAISAGMNNYLVLKSDGTVWAWGFNGYGQLGNGTTTNSTTPVQVSGLSGVTAISVEGNHSLALKSDGTVWAWGHNKFGQLGNGTTTNSITPGKVTNLTGIIAISAGGNHSLALKSDGTVWSWGYNYSGQLGDGTNISKTIRIQVVDNNTGFLNLLQNSNTIPVTGITLDADSMNLFVGDSETLTATVQPSNASNKNVSWWSSEPGIATVDSAGKVTGVTVGNAIIRVTAQDGNYTTACNVTVIDAEAPEVSTQGDFIVLKDPEFLVPVTYDCAAGFTVTENGVDVPVTGVRVYDGIDGWPYSEIELTLQRPVTVGSDVVINYVFDPDHPITVRSGSSGSGSGGGTHYTLPSTSTTVVNHSAQPVTISHSTVTVAGDGQSMHIELPTAVHTYNYTGSAGFYVSSDGTPITITRVVTSGSGVDVYFRDTIPSGSSVSVGYEPSSEYPITTIVGDSQIVLDSGGSGGGTTVITVPNTSAAPVVLQEPVTSPDGQVVTIPSPINLSDVTYNDNSGFRVFSNGVEIPVVKVEVKGNKIILYLGAPLIGNGIFMYNPDPDKPIKWNGDFPDWISPSVDYIEIIPTEYTASVGETKQLQVKAHFQGGSIAIVTNFSTYVSDRTATAAVDSKGIVTAVSPGIANITATFYEKTATCKVTVINGQYIPVIGVTLDVDDLQLAVGETKTLIATITPSDATNQKLTWVSSDPNIATIDENGKVTGIKPGVITVTVTTEDGKLSATCTVTVTPATPTIQSLLVFPTPINLLVGQNQQITVKVRYSDGSIKEVTPDATYTSSKPEIAAMNATNANQVNGIAVGTATVTVSYEGKSVNIPVTISNPVAKSLYIEPSPINLAVGMTKDVKVIAKLSNGNILDVTNQTNLVITDVTKASISGKTITGVQQGTTTLTATYQGISATAMVIVQAPIIQSLTITPNPINIAVGKTSEVLVVKAVKSDGTEEIISNSKVQFSFGNAGIAAITGDYCVLGKTVGTSVLTASYSGLTAQTNVNVGQAAIERLIVNPNPISVTVGKSVAITATAIYSDGSQQTVKATMTPHESNAGFTISNSQLTGTVVGNYNLDATYEGQNLLVPVTVTAPTVESISVSDITVGVGQTKTIQATAHMSDGTTLDISATAAYTLMNNSIASVTGNQITGRSTMGKTTDTTVLLIKYLGMSTNANVTITAPVATGLTVAPNPIVCNVGDTVELNVVATMSDGSSKIVTTSATYGISNQICDVNGNGVLLALKTGTSEVIITYNGNSVSIPVTVNYQPEPIKVVQGNYKILITSAISGDVNVKFTLTSNDPSTVYIPSSTSNRVYGKKLGICTITVTYYNSKSGISASYQVPVQVVSVPVNKPK